MGHITAQIELKWAGPGKPLQPINNNTSKFQEIQVHFENIHNSLRWLRKNKCNLNNMSVFPHSISLLSLRVHYNLQITVDLERHKTLLSHMYFGTEQYNFTS